MAKGGSKLRSGRTRGFGHCLLGGGLVAALALSLAGCAGTPFDGLEKKFKNPFAKKEVPLPGERVAIITDPTAVVADPAEVGRPVQLPAPQANASWSQAGGTPTNSLGHLRSEERRVGKGWR